MKKIPLLLLAFILPMPMVASATTAAKPAWIVNNSKFPISVDYARCRNDQVVDKDRGYANYICKFNLKIEVAANSHSEINFNDNEYIRVTTAVAKDANSKAIARSQGICTADAGGVVIFNDYGTSRLVCQEGKY